MGLLCCRYRHTAPQLASFNQDNASQVIPGAARASERTSPPSQSRTESVSGHRPLKRTPWPSCTPPATSCPPDRPWAWPTRAGNIGLPGTASAQTLRWGSRIPPDTAPTASPSGSSGPWGKGRTSSCPRTSRTSLGSTGSARTWPARRSCIRSGTASCWRSACRGSRRATGT